MLLPLLLVLLLLVLLIVGVVLLRARSSRSFLPLYRVDVVDLPWRKVHHSSKGTCFGARLVGERIMVVSGEWRKRCRTICVLR